MLLLKLTTVFSFLSLCQSEFCNYYWRDYDGQSIPLDAVPGGTRDDKPFYVGQAYVQGYELLVTDIPDPSSGKKPVVTAYDKTVEVKANVKILCSPVKENFKWIPTESKNLHLINDTNFVIGGSEVGQQLYIGRVNHDNKPVVGKIFQHSESNRGIWIPTQNGQPKNYDSYEVLTFKCGQNISGHILL